MQNSTDAPRAAANHRNRIETARVPATKVIVLHRACALPAVSPKGAWVGMQQRGIDRLARALAVSRSRRHALVAVAATFGLVRGFSGFAAKNRRTTKAAFSRKCHRFIISAGPNRDDAFEHTDDDVLIEIIPKKGGSAKVVFNDNNKSANGPNGDHLQVPPFTAKVGDKVHIVARNEVAGGCELDEIWLHCIEGRGGKVKLLDRFTPEQCSAQANTTGIFLDRTIRIRNK
jgi:hypothetical protein